MWPVPEEGNELALSEHSSLRFLSLNTRAIANQDCYPANGFNTSPSKKLYVTLLLSIGYNNTRLAYFSEGTRQGHLKATTSTQNASSIFEPPQTKTEDGCYELLKNKRPRGKDEGHYAIPPPCCRNHEKTDHQQPRGYTNTSPTPGSSAVAEKGNTSSKFVIYFFCFLLSLQVRRVDGANETSWDGRAKNKRQNNPSRSFCLLLQLLTSNIWDPTSYVSYRVRHFWFKFGPLDVQEVTHS